MSDLGTLELDKDDPDPQLLDSGGGGGGLGPILVGLVVIALIGAGGYWAYQRFKPATRPVATPAPPPKPAPISTPTPPVLPPLADSDGFIRDLLKSVSPDPRFADWLAQDNLVRRFANVVDVLADGGLPSGPLAFLAPASPFAARQQRGQTVIDPKTHERYDAVADVIASLDAATCARVLGWVTPLLDEAYKDLGHPKGGVAQAVDASIAEVTGVHVPEGDIALHKVDKVRPIYTFADKDLEALSAAQKALIRMGPSNAAKIQAKLAEIRPLLAPPAPSTSP
jgi:hypothetical protein